jgi:hypothetical protein
VRAWSGERGAGSGDFESGEQELLSKFDKYQNSTRNRNLDGNFLPNILFLVKSGTCYNEHQCQNLVPKAPVGTKFHPWILAMCTDL